MSSSDIDFERAVLQEMHDSDCWGSHTIRRDRVIHSCVPGHFRGEASKAMDKLIKKGWICYHNKSKGAIFLNLSFKAEIEKKIADGNNIS